MSKATRCLRHHNVATVFVAIVSVAMISMLLCMRSYVPQQLAQENSESKALMDEACTERERVGVGSNVLRRKIQQLMNNVVSTILISKHKFGRRQITYGCMLLVLQPSEH